ncbi:MAG: transketolase [Clostridiales bacterium]|nr:transketolase [Clostridiales bacterium]
MTIEEKTINTISMLSADMVQKANSGHPGAPMGMAAMSYALWMHALKHNPKHPQWENRDRFVLSNGHASALLYSLLHITGYGLSMEEIKQFRQWNSKTPGHPEYQHTVGVETTTGPLGQGVANAVGFAIAETMLAAHFNRPDFPIVDHRTYVFAGDGCMMEGITSEAASLAGTLKLSKLTILYDDNEISIEGSTNLAFREDVGMRFEAYGWHVIRVKNGNDYHQVLEALNKSQNSDKPVLIICPTIIGYGSKSKQGTASAHGEPLGDTAIGEVRSFFGMSDKTFHVAKEVYQHAEESLKPQVRAYSAWQDSFNLYKDKYPELASQWAKWHSEVDMDSLMQDTSLFEANPQIEATRVSSGRMINRLAKLFPNLVGGSADLAPSTKTYITDGGDYSAENRSGRNFRFGVREHAMAAICNGIAIHGGLRVFCATFFVFTDYMKAAMRLAAIMKLPVTYVLTHDSIGVGEDGTTHQPIEHLAALRATPDMQVIRPCDSQETTVAWIKALTSKAPTCLVLTRQNLPQYQRNINMPMKGGYVLSPAQGKAEVILMASGSEVSIAMDAQTKLASEGIQTQVVSMMSMEMYLNQDNQYKESVLPDANRRRIAIEAGATMPWYRFVGLDGDVLGLDHYGASAPQEVLFREYGLTAENLVSHVKALLAK